MKSSRVPLKPHPDNPLFPQLAPSVTTTNTSPHMFSHIFTTCVSQGIVTNTHSNPRCSEETEPTPTPIHPETANPSALDAMPTSLAKVARRVSPPAPLPQLITILRRWRPRPTHRMLVTRYGVTLLSLRPKVDIAHLAPQTTVALIIRAGCPHAFSPRPTRSVSPLPPSPRFFYQPFSHPFLPNLPVPLHYPRPHLLLCGLVLRV